MSLPRIRTPPNEFCFLLGAEDCGGDTEGERYVAGVGAEYGPAAGGGETGFGRGNGAGVGGGALGAVDGAGAGYETGWGGE